MKRREFISKAVLAAMALPCILTKESRASALLVGILIAIVVIGTIFYELWKICNKFLKTPAPPPPDKDPNQIARRTTNGLGGAGGEVNIPFSPNSDYFCNIPDKTPGFETPSGTYYTGMFRATVVDRTKNGDDWEPTGTVLAWISEDYVKVQNLDPLGNSIWVQTTPGWNSSSPLMLLCNQMLPASQRFFKFVAMP